MSGKNSNIVAHNIFGEGVIIERRWDDAQARVQFRSGLTLWLPAKWLKPLSVTEKEIDRVAAKRMLEAFRLGIVPHQDVEYFTFGRGYEIDALEQGLQRLRDGTGDAYVIQGTYGSGKSHLLEYVRHRALKLGLATSCAALHIQETPPHRPKKIYHDLVYGLRYIARDAEYGFRDLLIDAAERLEIDDHCFFTPVLKRVRELDAGDLRQEVFWQWIEGESTKEYATDKTSPYRIRGGHEIPALYDFSTAADFYNYILSGLSAICHRLGLGGLVIILDEFETLAHVWESALYRRGSDFLEGLIRVALNDAEMKKIDRRLTHNQVRPTPYSYRESRILLVLATTPSENTPITDLCDKKIFLRKLSRPELELIFDNLVKLYQCAYPGFAPESGPRENVLTAALNRNREELREFIKFTVDALDWMRLNRGDR